MVRIHKNWRPYLMVGVALLIAFGLIGYGFLTGERLYTLESPLLNTIREIELEASRTRFWMDDVLAGHEKYESDTLHWTHIDQSIRYLESLARGNQASVLALGDRGHRDIFTNINKLESILDAWKNILSKFNNQKPDRSQAAQSRAEMERAFSDFAVTLFEIKTAVGATIEKSLFRFRLVQAVLIGVSVLLTALAAITIYGYDRQKSLALKQLEEGRQELKQELSQRKEAQVALAEREQLLRTVFDSSPVALVLTRLADNHIADVNETFVATSGYKKAEVLGRTFQEIPVWEEPSDRNAVLQRLARERRVRDLEFGFRMKDGSVRAFLISANIVEINGEEHILSSALDVTERKEAEAKMMWLASFPLFNPYPVVEVDPEGQVHYLNPAAEKAFPGLSGQGAGHPWLSDWGSVMRSFRSGGEKAAVREVFFGGKWYHQSLIWVEDARRVRIYGLDITGRRQAEETLKTSHDALDAWVDERTRQLLETNQRLKAEVEERLRTERSLMTHQMQLRKLSSALVQTEERERRRISTAIHDGIGQTLAATKIKLGALRSLLPPSELLGQLDEVRDLISSAILETRTLTFELSLPVLYEIGLKPALEWMAEQFQRKYGLEVVIDGDGGDGDLDVPDRVFLFQAIREFCFNVVKHAQATRAMVSIRGDGNSGIIRCEVADDGVGFDVAKHAQAVGTEMGFGLFSIREQLRQCGGALTLDTAPGAGTRVVLRLPLNIMSTLQGGAVDEDPGAIGG